MTRRYLVTGVVQGVGFRAFARHAARRLSLVGSATNLPDGRVEVVASGPEAALAEFEGTLRRGPRFGRVDRIEASEISVDETLLSSFDIK